MTTLQPEVKLIKFDSDQHTAILERLRKLKKVGKEARQHRHAAWERAERHFSMYVPEQAVDAKRRGRRTSSGIPEYTTVTIPYAYATLLTMHTYFASVFLARSPIMQLEGRHGEGEDQARKVEALLDYQIQVGKNLPALYLWLLEHGKYGESFLVNYWHRDEILVPESFRRPKSFLGVDIPGTNRTVTELKSLVTYEGSCLLNIRPHDFYHDPNVTAAQLQKGDFVGWERFVSPNYVKKLAKQGYYFNEDKVESAKQAMRRDNTGQSPTAELPGANGSTWRDPEGVLIDEIVVELFPDEAPWGLAKRDNLEKWVFTVANESVIIGCQPLGLYHNQYPVVLQEYEFEGYNVAKRGLLEMLEPLNNALEWLINSHFYNVRKSLNNEWIYDPSVLMSADVERPGPGKLIRVRPEKFGVADLRNAFLQVPVMDVTSTHLRDAQLIIEMMQRVSGVNDSVMGLLSNTRRSATEIRSSTSFAVNRLKTACEYMSAQGFGPLTQQMLQLTQQMYTTDKAIQLRNRAGFDTKYLSLTAEDIAGFYDYVPVDGTMPIDRVASSQMFGQLMQQAAQLPPVASQLDFMKMFEFQARHNLGVRNFDSFRIQVAPTGQVDQNLSAGNVIPLNEAMGAVQ